MRASHLLLLTTVFSLIIAGCGASPTTQNNTTNVPQNTTTSLVPKELETAWGEVLRDPEDSLRRQKVKAFSDALGQRLQDLEKRQKAGEDTTAAKKSVDDFLGKILNNDSDESIEVRANFVGVELKRRLLERDAKRKAGEDATAAKKSVDDFINIVFGDSSTMSKSAYIKEARFRVAAINAMEAAGEDTTQAGEDLLEFLALTKLERGTSLSLSSGFANTSNRNVRMGKGGVSATAFNINNQSMDQSIDFAAPMVVQLKGNLDTAGKDSDAVGSVAYNMNGWVAGVVHGYANIVDQLKTHESAVMVSTSFNGFFVEGQVSALLGVNKYDQSISGARYLMTLGYDSSSVSPFIQYQNLNVDGADRHGVYMGLDTDVLSVQTSDAVVTSKILAKFGYECDVKSESAVFVEWTSGLKLNNGLEISNTLNLGSSDQSVKLTINFDL